MHILPGTRLTTPLITLITLLAPLAAHSSPLLGKWKLFEIVDEGPVKKLEMTLKESAERMKNSNLSVIELTQEKILIDTKELCIGESELYEKTDFRRYDKDLVEKNQFHRARMNPEYDLGAILQICKKKGRQVNGLEFFVLPEWIARCRSKERDDIKITSHRYYPIDENTLLAQGSLNSCFRRLRSPDDTGNYFVLEALRGYSPNKSEPASEEFLKPIKVQIPKSIPVTKGNPGNLVATLDFKDSSGHTTSCAYKGNVSKKTPNPTQLAYEFVECNRKKKAQDTLSVVSVKLRVLNSEKNAGITAAEVTFDYQP